MSCAADTAADSPQPVAWPCLQVPVATLAKALPMLLDVLLLCLFAFFVFGIVAVQLFAGALRNRYARPHSLQFAFCGDVPDSRRLRHSCHVPALAVCTHRSVSVVVRAGVQRLTSPMPQSCQGNRLTPTSATCSQPTARYSSAVGTWPQMSPGRRSRMPLAPQRPCGLGGHQGVGGHAPRSRSSLVPRLAPSVLPLTTRTMG